jgi:26 proteasome complex subunit DSS1
MSEKPVEDNVIKTLEEDDEFEDFPEDSKWDGKVNGENLWEQDWDDEDNLDEFSQRLREELARGKK